MKFGSINLVFRDKQRTATAINEYTGTVNNYTAYPKHKEFGIEDLCGKYLNSLEKSSDILIKKIKSNLGTGNLDIDNGTQILNTILGMEMNNGILLNTDYYLVSPDIIFSQLNNQTLLRTSESMYKIKDIICTTVILHELGHRAENVKSLGIAVEYSAEHKLTLLSEDEKAEIEPLTFTNGENDVPGSIIINYLNNAITYQAENDCIEVLSVNVELYTFFHLVRSKDNTDLRQTKIYKRINSVLSKTLSFIYK